MDASAALAWLLPGEPYADAAAAIAQAVASEGALVPSIWPPEVLNGMLMAVRRRRIDRAACDEQLGLLQRLPIAFDGETHHRTWDDTKALAEKHGLTAYDAAYLELAVRAKRPLGSFDDALRAAARSEGVAVLE